MVSLRQSDNSVCGFLPDSPDSPGIHIPMHCNASGSHLCARLLSKVGDPFGEPSNSTKLLEAYHFMSFLQIHKKSFIEIRIHLVARALLDSTIIKVRNWMQRCGMKFPSAACEMRLWGFVPPRHFYMIWERDSQTKIKQIDSQNKYMDILWLAYTLWWPRLIWVSVATHPKKCCQKSLPRRRIT